ncbi:PTS system fructose-specific IIABC component [Spiroplasma sabaudiense Ar-1343]|uniref:PTS system fructose-specific IIABC component n=1 Tax=Spiroplasma sabaudiense Ar-1343 TaxID=1276257 RepID=W6AB38_9MOLU|nr:fructose-specific PTS transporter subunit EIIC [Spiroplasma sabaudiense]AHI54075.1 PTS system fructose-specific IIABC component [Spiroplasma sabaudiense Ar-1343]
MELKNLFSAQTSFFDVDLQTREEVIEFLAAKLAEQKVINNEKAFVTAIKKRESQGSTGIGDGIAIPHALDKSVNQTCVAFANLKNPVDWDSLDGKPTKLVFMIMTNGKNGEEHLSVLADLSTYLMKEENQKVLMKAKKIADLEKVFGAAKAEEQKLKAGQHYDVVGITACPTGIAHTYMSAEKLVEVAKKMGLTVKVETQGRRGTENQLTPEDIENAKVRIIGIDKQIDGLGRFNGFDVIKTNTKDVIYNAEKLIEGFSKGEKVTKIQGEANSGSQGGGNFSLNQFKDIKGNLLGGVSKMLPFVVAGGIILGIGFLIDFAAGNANAGGDYGTVNSVAGWFSGLGKVAMGAMVPILAAYICFSIVGPQGLMPGFVAGVLANGDGMVYGDQTTGWGNLWGKLLPSGLPYSSGFIGAMVGAYLAAFIVFGWSKAFGKVSKGWMGVRDIVFVPVLSLLGIGVVMFAINIPLGYVMLGIQEGLTFLSTPSKTGGVNLLILVGALVGFMMCVDMGGPINKIAYTLGTMTVGGTLTNGLGTETVIMAAAMAGGMIPPLGVALCTVLFKKVWSVEDRDAAKANWLMGACFISEGAIPFMVKDPKRVALSAMAGGLITGLIVGAFTITLAAPHGGVFVFPLLESKAAMFSSSKGLAIGMGVSLYLLAIVVGTFTMALILGFWKLADVEKASKDTNLIEEVETSTKKAAKAKKQPAKA